MKYTLLIIALAFAGCKEVKDASVPVEETIRQKNVCCDNGMYPDVYTTGTVHCEPLESNWWHGDYGIAEFNAACHATKEGEGE